MSSRSLRNASASGAMRDRSAVQETSLSSDSDGAKKKSRTKKRPDWRSTKFKQLTEELAAVTAAVAALRDENRQLKDIAASLVHLNNMSAYLGTFVAMSDINMVTLPSARVGPAHAEEAASLAYSRAAAALPVGDDITLDMLDVPNERLRDIDVHWRGVMMAQLSAWDVAKDPAERASLQRSIVSFTTWGHRLRRMGAMTRPERYAQFMAALLGASARRSKEREVLLRIAASAEGVEKLREALAVWKSRVLSCVIEERGAVMAALAPGAMRPQEEFVSLREAAVRALATMDAMNRRTQAIMMAECDFSAAMSEALGWQNWADICFKMLPYSADHPELCLDILQRAGAA